MPISHYIYSMWIEKENIPLKYAKTQYLLQHLVGLVKITETHHRPSPPELYNLYTVSVKTDKIQRFNNILGQNLF